MGARSGGVGQSRGPLRGPHGREPSRRRGPSAYSQTRVATWRSDEGRPRWRALPDATTGVTPRRRETAQAECRPMSEARSVPSSKPPPGAAGGDAPAKAAPAQKSAPQKAMEKLGLTRDIDLALHLPLRYEDETTLAPLGDARDGDTLAGGLDGHIHWRWLYVRQFWIAPLWRGKGLGRAGTLRGAPATQGADQLLVVARNHHAYLGPACRSRGRFFLACILRFIGSQAQLEIPRARLNPKSATRSRTNRVVSSRNPPASGIRAIAKMNSTRRLHPPMTNCL